MTRRVPRALVLGALLASACGDAEAPQRWRALARGFEPAPLLPLVQDWQRAGGMDPGECRAFFAGVQIAHPLARAAWSAGAEPGVWTSAFPGGAFGHGTSAPGFLLLESSAGNAVEAPPDAPRRKNTFRVSGGRVELCLPAGVEPAADLRLVQYVENGRASDGAWQVRVGNDECHVGIPVWSGTTVAVECRLPSASRLSFEPRFLTRAAPAPVTLRVRLDDALVFERVADSAALEHDGNGESVALPPEARAHARIEFEVAGPPGQALFLHPSLGPADVGRYGARPWSDARPDVVLFLADTFRADGLELGGGARDLAPNLNRFAEGAVRFRNARANAAWTLPSIGTILTGLAPGQHTANDTQSSLPAEVVTLAERLARAGYRTGAVTDAAFFSAIHGLDQGFESFRANPATSWDLDWTVAKALEFLARDDGRSVFLVLHTYRTHMPYRVGDEESLAPWNALRNDGCKPLEDKPKLPVDAWRARLAECAPRFRALYEEGVKDLDRGFGEFLAGLERTGLLARGVLVFTSDHGEALGENHDIFHGGALWDSKLHVPLLVHGPGLAPRTVDFGVSPLDLAPTLAALTGLERDPLWHGESLLDVASERPLFAFWLQKTKQFALLEGTHVVLAKTADDLAGGRCELAFDLAADPREERPVADAPWAGELARRHAGLLRALLVPAGAAAAAPLDVHHQNELRGLGYGGGDGTDEEDGAVPPAEEPKPK